MMCGVSDALDLDLTPIFRPTSKNSQALYRINLTISTLPEMFSSKGRDEKRSK